MQVGVWSELDDMHAEMLFAKRKSRRVLSVRAPTIMAAKAELTVAAIVVNRQIRTLARRVGHTRNRTDQSRYALPFADRAPSHLSVPISGSVHAAPGEG